MKMLSAFWNSLCSTAHRWVKVLWQEQMFYLQMYLSKNIKLRLIFNSFVQKKYGCWKWIFCVGGEQNWEGFGTFFSPWFLFLFMYLGCTELHTGPKFPDQGLNPEVWSLNHWTTKKFPGLGSWGHWAPYYSVKQNRISPRGQRSFQKWRGQNCWRTAACISQFCWANLENVGSLK